MLLLVLIGTAFAVAVVLGSFKGLVLLGLPLIYFMLRSPRIGLLATAASTATGFLWRLNKLTATVSLSIPKVLGMVTALSLVFEILRARRRVYMGLRVLVPAAFLAASAHSLLYNEPLFGAWRTMAQLTASFAFYFLAVNIVRDEKTLRQLLWVMVLAHTINGLWSLIQLLYPSTWDSAKTTEYLFEQHEQYQSYVDRGIQRATGTTHPNIMSFIMTLLIPYAVYLHQTEEKVWRRSVLLVCLVICVWATLMSKTRAAFFNLFLILFVLWIKGIVRITPPMILSAVVAVPLVVMFVLPQQFVSRVLSFGEYLQEGSVRVRLENQQVALQFFAEHPIVGVGAGNFESRFKSLGIAGQLSGVAVGRTTNLEVTNLLVEVAAETGVVGLAAILAFLIMLFRDTLRLERMGGYPRRSNIATYTFVTLLVSLFASFFTSIQNWREWWLLMAVPGILWNLRVARFWETEADARA